MAHLPTTQLVIAGGCRIEGSIAAQGGKNAALPIMAASLLNGGPLLLDNVPDVGDVRTMAELLRVLGMRADRLTPNTWRLAPGDSHPCDLPVESVRKMRASICLLAPLLVRNREVELPLPGGCDLGPRPIDLHLRVLTEFGAAVRMTSTSVIASAERLRPANVSLRGPRGPSVTGTATALLAAVRTAGTSVISDAALEPEITDLAKSLNRMGARISGLGTPTLVVDGVDKLHAADHRLIGDRIEAATLLLAAAMTRGRLEVTRINPSHLRTVLAMLSRAGASVNSGVDRISIQMRTRPRGFSLTTSPFPAIPTDLQPLWTAVASVASTQSKIADRVFPGRFRHLRQLRRFGALVEQSPDDAGAVIVHPRAALRAATVDAPDLRAAAALALIALISHGESRIASIEHLDRGYERFDEKLKLLGADVERIPASSTAVDRQRRCETPMPVSKLPASTTALPTTA